ncbi:MAG TPA: hypothetical protein VKB80_34215 [Kofleriaceae bacterium]|nr:hypothetical protein [Kofleriaceae bacterium]
MARETWQGHFPRSPLEVATHRAIWRGSRARGSSQGDLCARLEDHRGSCIGMAADPVPLRAAITRRDGARRWRAAIAIGDAMTNTSTKA